MRLGILVYQKLKSPAMLPFIFAIFLGSVLLALMLDSRSGPTRDLNKIPNAQFSAPYTRLWLLWIRWKGWENRTRLALHRHLGPVVRIGPREISINCIEGGVQLVYGSDFAKDDWYARAFFGVETPYMFTMLRREDHSARKRLLSAMYTKSHILNSAELEDYVLTGLSRLDSKLKSWSNGGPVEVLEQMRACMMDLTTPWLYGSYNGTDFLRNIMEREAFLTSWREVGEGFFWRGEFYNLTRMLQYLGVHLVPRKAAFSLQNVQDWGAKMTAEASKSYLSKSTSGPSLYRHFRNHHEKAYPEISEEERDRIMSAELLDHAIASHDVGGITLTYVMYELSRHRDVQKALQTELRSLENADERSNQSLPKRIDELPLLDAILTETLRLHTPSPGPLPRVVPQSGCRLAERYDVPSGTVVSATGYTLHRNLDIFPNPDEWRPARWLDADEASLAEMKRWYWAFGSGARVCIAKHLAERDT